MGLNSGTMVVGNMGLLQRINYTVMGDAVNLASRLEGANKAYSSQIMISESTYLGCQEDVDVRELDTIRVVGRMDPVKVYELLDRKNQTTAAQIDLAEQFSKGLELYKQTNFADAKSQFEQCLQIFSDDGPSLTYIARCQEYAAEPPEDSWDGVFTLTEKG